jgi:hypothetical protein
METNKQINIGWPTNVKHLVHVSFDRFKGFVGLPEDMGEEQKNAPGARRGRLQIAFLSVLFCSIERTAGFSVLRKGLRKLLLRSPSLQGAGFCLWCAVYLGDDSCLIEMRTHPPRFGQLSLFNTMKVARFRAR